MPGTVYLCGEYSRISQKNPARQETASSTVMIMRLVALVLRPGLNLSRFRVVFHLWLARELRAQ